jgi:hypothetical protein
MSMLMTIKCTVVVTHIVFRAKRSTFDINYHRWQCTSVIRQPPDSVRDVGACCDKHMFIGQPIKSKWCIAIVSGHIRKYLDGKSEEWLLYFLIHKRLCSLDNKGTNGRDWRDWLPIKGRRSWSEMICFYTGIILNKFGISNRWHFRMRIIPAQYL